LEFEWKHCFLIHEHKDLMPIVETQTPEHKDMMPSGETHLMHSAHPQVALKMKRSRLQMALYSYGDGASQKRID